MYEDLYEANKRLLWAVAQRYRGACERDRALAMEDLLQSGFIGLMAAQATFDPGSGMSWAFYARLCIQQEIGRAIGPRARSRDAPSVFSLDAPLADESDDTFGDQLPDDSLPPIDDALLLEELRTGVREALDALADPRQRRIAELCAIEGRPMPEAAAAMGVTTGRAMQLYGRALASLARDRRLRALADQADLDERTRFHAHKGVRAFLNDRTSVTEEAALWRIQQRERGGR